MAHIGIRALQRDTSRAIERAVSGERIVITRHNRPVAVLVGVAGVHQAIRSLHLKPEARLRLRREFDRWAWSGEPPPLNVLVAMVAGDRPVREVSLED